MFKHRRLAGSFSWGKITISSSLAIISSILGVIGLSGWCCTIVGVAVFSFLGITSISSYLVYYNKWLFLISSVFTSLAIFYYIKHKGNKGCSTRNK
jgi:hypothetical protein